MSRFQHRNSNRISEPRLFSHSHRLFVDVDSCKYKSFLTNALWFVCRSHDMRGAFVSWICSSRTDDSSSSSELSSRSFTDDDFHQKKSKQHGITVMRCLFMAVFTQTTVNYRKRTAYSHLRTEASPSSTRGQRKEEKKEVSRLLNSIHRTSHFIPICS